MTNTEEQKIIEYKLLEVFKDLGIYVDVNDFNADIIDDSLQLVNVVLALEETFMVPISDDFIGENKLSSFNDFYSLIKSYYFN